MLVQSLFTGQQGYQRRLIAAAAANAVVIFISHVYVVAGCDINPLFSIGKYLFHRQGDLASLAVIVVMQFFGMASSTWLLMEVLPSPFYSLPIPAIAAPAYTVADAIIHNPLLLLFLREAAVTFVIVSAFLYLASIPSLSPATRTALTCIVNFVCITLFGPVANPLWGIVGCLWTGRIGSFRDHVIAFSLSSLIGAIAAFAVSGYSSSSNKEKVKEKKEKKTK